jgi:hypothetical protein
MIRTTNRKNRKKRNPLGFHPGFPPGFDPRRAERGLAQRSVKAERVCRVCGCTDLDCRGCIERTGEPCYWVEPDLCSACKPAEEKPKTKAKAASGR